MKRASENIKNPLSHPSQSWDLDSGLRRHDDLTQKGNAIFLIIVAVALFAALSYAIINTSRTSTSLLTDEEATAYANQIIAYGNEVKTAVRRMQLRGVDDTEFSFENNIFTRNDGTLVSTAGDNPNCTNQKCQIFNINGGGISANILSNGATASAVNTATTSIKPGHWRENVGSVEGVGTPENELFYAAAWIDQKVCIKINDILGIENPSGIPALASGTLSTYNGTFSAIGNWPGATQFDGEKQFCYQINSTPVGYVFLQVLIAR